MQNAAITTQQIIKQIKALPKDSLDDLAAYVESGLVEVVR